MKKITVFGRVMVENRTYQAGEHSEASIPAGDLEVLLKGGFAEISGDEGQSVPVNQDMSPKTEDEAPQDLFPSGVLKEDVEAQAARIADLLSGSVKDIKDGLSALTDDGLLEMHAAEASGKNRKGVLEAIEDEIAVRENSGNEGGNE